MDISKIRNLLFRLKSHDNALYGIELSLEEVEICIVAVELYECLSCCYGIQRRNENGEIILNNE